MALILQLNSIKIIMIIIKIDDNMYVGILSEQTVSADLELEMFSVLLFMTFLTSSICFK